MTHAPKPEPLLPEDFQRVSGNVIAPTVVNHNGIDCFGLISGDADDIRVVCEALRRCAHPSPPSDGAAAVLNSPDFRSKAPLGDAAHGDTAVVAALPEGVMSAARIAFEKHRESYYISHPRLGLRSCTWDELPPSIQDQWHDVATAVIAAQLSQAKEGWVLVPKEATEKMWGELARDIIMWLQFGPRHTGEKLHSHLQNLGREIPVWLSAKIPNDDSVPPKGTIAVCIYKAMIAAAPQASGEA